MAHPTREPHPNGPDKPNLADGHDPAIIDPPLWTMTPAGRYALAWEQQQFDHLVADIFGYRALQLGLLNASMLRANRMPFVFRAAEPSAPARALRAEELAGGVLDEEVTPDSTQEASLPLLVTRFDELPFAAQSLDLVVLPHTLEFSADPHQVLREVERVLIPEGQLVISGFNPASLWGLRQGLGGMTGRPFLPDAVSFLALPRLKDWLKLLGFEVNRGRFGCYRPPFRSEKWIQRMAFLEPAGDRWWPIGGAVYMIGAVKRVRGVRLIGPTWREPVAAPRAFRPAANSSSFPLRMID